MAFREELRSRYDSKKLRLKQLERLVEPTKEQHKKISALKGEIKQLYLMMLTDAERREIL